MEYNLSKEAFFIANTSVGNVSLNIDTLVSIMNNTASVSLSGPSGNILCIDIDLGMCISCDEIRYYFSSASISGTVSSGINISYKNESYDNYTSLNISLGNGYYIGDVPIGSTLSPKYIRLIHTLNGTSISGIVNGLLVINNDNVVDFGIDGTMINDTFTALIDTPTIRTIPIYNNSDRTATAYVSIEPQGDYVDDILYISNSEDGPWIGVRESIHNIVNSTSWGMGTHSSTTTIAGRLVLATGFSVGNYKTSVFSSDFSKYNCLDLEMEFEHSSPIVKVDDADTIQTLEVRGSNIRPLNYRVYRTIYMNTIRIPDTSWSTVKTWGASDYYIDDNTLAVDYGDFMRWNIYLDNPSNIDAAFHQKGLYTIITKNRVMYTLNIYYARISPTVGGDNRITLCCVNNNYTPLDGGDYAETFTSSNNYIDIYKYSTVSSSTTWTAGALTIYKIIPDDFNGLWLYMYIQNGGTSYLITQGGYYLFHFSYSLSLTKDLQIYNSSNFIYDMDVVTDGATQKIWYIDKNTNDLIRMSKTGVVDISVSLTTIIERIATGVTTADDGGCWIIAAPNVYKFSNSGVLESTLNDVVSNDVSKKYISRDKDEDGLWLLEIGSLKRIWYDGRTDFVYSGTSTLIEIIESVDSGVWLKRSSDNYYVFFDKKSKSIIRSTGSSSINLQPGMIDYSYNNTSWGSMVPSSKDSVWNNLTWSKVATDHYSLNEDVYKQLRITLRTSMSSNLYGVNSVDINKYLEVPNIPAGGYRNIYLKTDVPVHDPNYFGSHSSNLKVWWDVPVWI